MAKPSTKHSAVFPSSIQPGEKLTPPIEHAVEIAHPLDLPSLMTERARHGWAVIEVVACRTTNEHAAYFRRG